MTDRRPEPYWVRYCPLCKRQMHNAAAVCCRWEFGKTMNVVPADPVADAIRLLAAALTGHEGPAPQTFSHGEMADLEMALEALRRAHPSSPTSSPESERLSPKGSNPDA